MSTHNPDGLSDEQIGVAEGWRLLNEDEVGLSDSVSGTNGPLLAIEQWQDEERAWGSNGYYGALIGYTYRTKLTPAELRKARGLDDFPRTEESNTSTEIAVLRSKLAESDKRCAAKDGMLNDASEEIAVLREHVAAKDAEIARMNDRINSALSSLEKAGHQMSDLRADLATARAERDAANRKHELIDGLLKDLCHEWQEDCDPKCDPIAHEETCRATNLIAAKRALNQENAYLRAKVEELTRERGEQRALFCKETQVGHDAQQERDRETMRAEKAEQDRDLLAGLVEETLTDLDTLADLVADSVEMLVEDVAIVSKLNQLLSRLAASGKEGK